MNQNEKMSEFVSCSLPCVFYMAVHGNNAPTPYFYVDRKRKVFMLFFCIWKQYKNLQTSFRRLFFFRLRGIQSLKVCIRPPLLNMKSDVWPKRIDKLVLELFSVIEKKCIKIFLKEKWQCFLFTFIGLALANRMTLAQANEKIDHMRTIRQKPKETLITNGTIQMPAKLTRLNDFGLVFRQ